jgi:hypothetical protein
MFSRLFSAAILAFFILGGSAQAQIQQIQFRVPTKLPDPRGEFVRLCVPHMMGRWAHPESVCSCLHDFAAARVEDPDLREALLRGIGETGVPISKPTGYRHRSNRKSAQPSRKLQSRRCNACSSR